MPAAIPVGGMVPRNQTEVSARDSNPRGDEPAESDAMSTPEAPIPLLPEGPVADNRAIGA